MAKSAKITLEWADGEYLFALRCGEIEELEADSFNPETGKKGIGIGAIWTRLMSGTWYINDVYNVIRLGLIGGGMEDVAAKRMVERYAKNKPVTDKEYLDKPSPSNPLTVAQAILAAAIIGVEENESAGEPQTPEQ